jgi:Bax protein
MVVIRTLLLAMVLMALYSGHALAYQYGYYSPNPYYAQPAYYNPYARAPYAYYPAYRYPSHRYPAQPVYAKARTPVQVPVANHAGIKTPVKNVAKDYSETVEAESVSADKADKSVSGLSGKKQAFITKLLPYIEQENRRLHGLRNTTAGMLSKIDSGIALSTSDQQHIKKLATKYRVKGDPLVDNTAREEMLRKIDIIPSSLALAQAANESAWGESRFAQEANNLFGIWTYEQDKGLKPKRREQGKTHLVRIFDDFEGSVRYYMYTLNSHPAYEKLREIRQQLRASDQVINGHMLAAGLEKYSAKGQAYIVLIQSLIKQNEWVLLDTGNQRA